MSKKSRKRNKKILAALALAGGAAMLAKGRGKGTGAVSTAGQAVGVDRITPPSKYIQKKIVPDIAEKVVPNTSSFKPRVYPGTMLNERPGPRHALPPSMKGGALHAEGWTPRNLTAGSSNPRRANIYKGGGIAKRGTGVALKSGGRVKSMGIAKRGGGAAKR